MSKVLYWPEACESGQLKISNNGNQTESVWLQKFNPLLVSEFEHVVSSQSTITVKVDKTSLLDRFSLLKINEKAKIKVTYNCGGIAYPTSALDGGLLTFKKTSAVHNKLWMQNLYTDKNKVVVEILDRNHQIIKSAEIILKASESFTNKLTETQNWSYLRISSTHKISAFLLTDFSASTPVEALPLNTYIEATSHYFLVGPRNNDADSFVIRLQNGEILNKARQLVKDPSLEKIVFARVQKDHLGFNRNFFNQTKSHWSWSTTEVTGFGDFGSTSCNGNPQMLEDRIDFWLNDPGQICFWNYRLKRELSKEEVSSGVLSENSISMVKKP